MVHELKVLIIDCDFNHLMTLENSLQNNHFEVTKCRLAREAISILQEDVNRFDVVIADLNMLDMDGFELLKYIGLEMNLPVLMTLETEDDPLIRKGLIYGACDFLIKPVKMENVKFLWKYPYLKQTNQGLKQSEWSPIDLNDSNSYCWENHFQENSDGEDDEKGMKKRKHASNLGDLLINDDATTKNKQRVIWTTRLHAKFVEAINQIGSAKVTPKKILEIMNVPGLTRDNVASHLQKYRHFQNHKRFKQITQHQNEGKNVISSAVDNVHNIREQVVTTSSSSYSKRDVTSLNSQNLRPHDHVKNGGNVIYQPVISCSHCSTQFHVKREETTVNQTSK